jgi:mRNA interferase RelE/StbE
MSYQVRMSTRARRDLNRFRGKTYLRLKSAIDELANKPRPVSSRKLEGRSREWRIRVGVYRILYTIDDETQELLIRRVAHRREVYR